jgi:hypothetical protein
VWTGGTREFGFPLVPTNGTPIALVPGTTLRYADSSKVEWPSNLLRVYGWSATGPGGGTHLFFGTNAQGLTAQQVAQLVFVIGGDDFPTRILTTGEVVPEPGARIIAARDSAGLVLSWAGTYELMTATNVAGPYYLIPSASSPYTNPFVAPEQYFKLRSLAATASEP